MLIFKNLKCVNKNSFWLESPGVAPILLHEPWRYTISSGHCPFSSSLAFSWHLWAIPCRPIDAILAHLQNWFYCVQGGALAGELGRGRQRWRQNWKAGFTNPSLTCEWTGYRKLTYLLCGHSNFIHREKARAFLLMEIKSVALLVSLVR